MDENTAPTLARMHECFLPWSRAESARTALVDADRSITYGDLPQVVDAIAQRLRDIGVRAGDRVLFVAENSVALAVCIMAASRIDAWSATVNARLSDREIDNFLSHSGARRALYFSANSPEALKHAQQRGAQEQEWPGIGCLHVGVLNEATQTEPVHVSGTEQTAVMVYTSGTTGAPKAVMLSHANLIFIGQNNLRMRGLQPGDVVYGVLPLSHVYGLSALLVACLLSGATLRLVPRYSPADLARALAEEGVTVLHGAPAMYAKLLEWSAARGVPLRAPHLRLVQSGGAPLTASLKQDFEQAFGLVLQNGYGMSEASPSIAQTRLDAPRADCSVGPAIPFIEITLHAPDAEGIGELWVRGPNVMLGYYKSPEATAATITPEGWLRTGDLARIDPDGALFIVGRSKELIIRSGFNVYPVEVEQALNAHPDVVQSAVVGRTVPGNEEVVAFVESAVGDALDLEALRAFLREQLSPYKIPAEIVVMPQLPAAATGKILKSALQKMAQARVEDRP